MNRWHRWYCRSDGWRDKLQGTYLPATVKGLGLDGDVLEIGPGPGLSTDWLRHRVTRLTAIEIDHRLAEALKRRLAGTNVTVVEGDASAMPFPDASFNAALCLTMLHHVPATSQDRLLGEACRVLRPGGILAGMDSRPSFRWNLYHLFDDRNPVDPDTFGARLKRAGFTEVNVQKSVARFTFRARRAA